MTISNRSDTVYKETKDVEFEKRPKIISNNGGVI